MTRNNDYYITFIFSTRLVSMIMVLTLWSHTILQKSPNVSGSGPCVAMYSRSLLNPCMVGI